ncbi:MAG: hypothetical protein P4M11_13155 [Candidatus Pacebacteria bacterium]|nr:hypothetical protein [Candidatus Paceibacterota bacterium]
MAQFLNGWIAKMDYIATHYGRRLNLLAVLSILPYLDVALLQVYMKRLMPYVLPLVENYIYTKESKGAKPSSSAALTPTKRTSYAHTHN